MPLSDKVRSPRSYFAMVERSFPIRAAKSAWRSPIDCRELRSCRRVGQCGPKWPPAHADRTVLGTILAHKHSGVQHGNDRFRAASGDIHSLHLTTHSDTCIIA